MKTDHNRVAVGSTIKPVDRGGLLLPGEPIYVRGKHAGGEIYMDGQEAAMTLACSHCGRHWVPTKRTVLGPGMASGECIKCLKCNGPVCSPKCAEDCYPYERRLDERNLFGDKPRDTAVKVYVPTDVP